MSSKIQPGPPSRLPDRSPTPTEPAGTPHQRPFGAEPSQDITSRFYDSMGNTLDYVYELEGDTLTIWGGKRGSPAYYTGRFSDDGNTVTGGVGVLGWRRLPLERDQGWSGAAVSC
jgi:hypothetical protein